MTTAQEIKRRRTFAIISHPDAGKTTMTEKLLLYGGQVHLAGTVKGRKAARHATSDWMEIEKQRGISVSSSVLQFEYDGYCINILDTPGHQDFSEDTYRTLVAADAAIMMIDGAKGVEEQTVKLFKVCRMRGIPIFTFVNKMDRATKSPFDLMDELEKVLGIFSVPINWPIGVHGDFKGLYNRQTGLIDIYAERTFDHGASKIRTKSVSLENIGDQIGADYEASLAEDIELLDIAGDSLDPDKVAAGLQTPLFFGSALTNFGVEFFLSAFLSMSPPPGPRKIEGGTLDPFENRFSGFVFKIQANMNPAHRDRLAFIRICSGRFEKDLEVTLARESRTVRLSQPQQFLAQDRNIVQEAYAGDIIGLFDNGQYRLGDSLVEGAPFLFESMPVFPPEHFARISPHDSMKRKQFQKGVSQLAEEGAIQVYREPDLGTETLVIGVVGVLQFDVLTYRLDVEYGVKIRQQSLPYRLARWVQMPPGRAADTLQLSSTTRLVTDEDGRYVLLFESGWAESWAKDRNPGLVLTERPTD
ncbi:MAG TPA: peptide chain release factor 3 [Clostridiaceae bacterium]|nr:peptide chain release factor 3 [Clostridiaceae bacterium]